MSEIASLNNLLTIVGTQLTNVNDAIAALEPQILAAQTEREQFNVEQTRLTRERDTVQEAYLALSRRVEEERIAAQDVGEGCGWRVKRPCPWSRWGRAG
ncbi:MAG: hypothetical protein R3E31_08665 [Chloroflexota bacterium]